MKILVIGGTGYAGSAVVSELLERKHQMSIATRNPNKVQIGDNLSAISVDVFDENALSEVFQQYEVVVNAYIDRTAPDFAEKFRQQRKAVALAAKKSGIRLIDFAGAGSLFVAPNVQLVDTPEFPEAIKEEAMTARETLAWLKEQDFDWTAVSPPVVFFNGSPFTEKLGTYRTETDAVLMKDGQPTGISNFDLAIAIADEIENPKFRKQRFTAGY